MATFSYDIECGFDKAEMNNAFTQAEKEIANRYDFRGTPAAIEWLKDKSGIKATGENEWQLDAVIDIFRKKLVARDMTSKVLDEKMEAQESNLKAWKDIPFRDSLSKDDAKAITALLKQKHPKLKAQIQGDSVRVSGTSKDELQAAMQTIRSEAFDFPVTFTNYR